jgi:molybdate transport system permease protein
MAQVWVCVLCLPLVLPPTVVGYMLLLAFGRRGVLGRLLDLFGHASIVFHWSGAVLASAVASFPLFLLPARGAFQGVDPQLEEAARLLGRRPIAVFATITLPLAARGLIAGSLLAFARALGDFGATLMVAGDLPGRTRTAALAVYDAVSRDDTTVALLYSGLVALVAVVVLMVVQVISSPRKGDA